MKAGVLFLLNFEFLPGVDVGVVHNLELSRVDAENGAQVEVFLLEGGVFDFAQEGALVLDVPLD